MDTTNMSYCVKKLQSCTKENCPAGKVEEEKELSDKERIEKLEQEVMTLHDEIKCMKCQHDDVEDAMLRAIHRGACALGGKFKVLLPESVTAHHDDEDEPDAPQMHCCNNHTAKNGTSSANDRKPNKERKFDTQRNCGNYVLG